MLDRILGFFSRDIGIDLGTANTLVHVRDRGIVMSEPSVVAIDAKTKRVLAVGAEAKRMVGRTPANIIAVRPLRDGVISDFDVTEQMIKYFVDKVHDRVGMIARPRMLLGIPSGVTEVEKRAVRDAAHRREELRHQGRRREPAHRGAAWRAAAVAPRRVRATSATRCIR
jgi:rod shape-determining protein MreB